MGLRALLHQERNQSRDLRENWRRGSHRTEPSHVHTTGDYLASPQLLADLGCHHVFVHHGYDADGAQSL